MNKGLNKVNKEIIDSIYPRLQEIETIKHNYTRNLFGKLKGNIVANVITKAIQNIIDTHNLSYKVSIVNSFVNGFPTEWDLLILDKNAKGISGINLYNPEDVYAVVEFKTGGKPNFKYKEISEKQFFQEQHSKYFDIVKEISEKANHEILYLYIGFSYWPNYFKACRDYFDESNNSKYPTAFVFLNDQSKNYPNEIMDDCYDFEKFILDLLKNIKR